MSKIFTRKRHPIDGNGVTEPSTPAAREATAGKVAAKRKSISFDPNRNKVRMIRVPPRSQNPEFWFSEKQKMVKKGLQFEIDPDISVEVNVDSRLQLGTIAYPMSKESSPAPSSPGKAAERAFLEVKESQLPLLYGGGPDDSDEEAGENEGRWLCVGSVAAGGMAKLNVTLPPGMYQLRCTGNQRPLQVFGQAWDVEMELV